MTQSDISRVPGNGFRKRKRTSQKFTGSHAGFSSGKADIYRTPLYALLQAARLTLYVARCTAWNYCMLCANPSQHAMTSTTLTSSLMVTFWSTHLHIIIQQYYASCQEFWCDHHHASSPKANLSSVRNGIFLCVACTAGLHRGATSLDHDPDFHSQCGVRRIHKI